MRYLAPIIAMALGFSGCGTQIADEPKRPEVVKEIDVYGKTGRVHFWQVDGRTGYIEISWSEEDEDGSRSYTLSANGGRRFYDTGEVEVLEEGNKEPRHFVLDAENLSACGELIGLSKKANRIRDSILAKNNITDNPVDPTPSYLEMIKYFKERVEKQKYYSGW